MSGVFFIVEDAEMSDVVLRPTRGGWPHITIVYTGDKVPAKTLLWRAALVAADWAGRKVTLTDAYINSFMNGDKMRYDVLMQLDTATTEAVREARATITAVLGVPFENDPHVTHAIFWTRAEAEAALALVKEHLPRTVTVTGYTVV